MSCRRWSNVGPMGLCWTNVGPTWELIPKVLGTLWSAKGSYIAPCQCTIQTAFTGIVIISSFLNRRLILDVFTLCPKVLPTSRSFIWRSSY